MRTKAAVLGVFAAAVLALSAAPAWAHLVYDWENNGGGVDQNYGFVVADNFTVNKSVSIDALSVFDSNFKTGGSIADDLYVTLYDDTANKVVIAPIDFKGVTDAGKTPFVTIFLSQSFTLIVGHAYSIEAYGFNAQDMVNELYDDGNGGKTDITFNSLGGALSNDGSGNCNGDSSTAFNAVNGTGCSGNFNAHANNFFGAGSFDVPEPSSWALMVGGLAGFGFLAYRRKRRMLSIV